MELASIGVDEQQIIDKYDLLRLRRILRRLPGVLRKSVFATVGC